MSKLDRAIQISTKAHENQIDKAGYPYILHPLRVMQNVLDQTDNQDLAIVAVLHDLIEDSNYFIADVEIQFGREIAGLIYELTKQKTESYDDYIDRLRYNEDLKRVKLADLADNMSEKRLALLDEPTRNRLRDKYQKAWDVLTKGNNA